jgi:hypothetical protein
VELARIDCVRLKFIERSGWRAVSAIRPGMLAVGFVFHNQPSATLAESIGKSLRSEVDPANQKRLPRQRNPGEDPLSPLFRSMRVQFATNKMKVSRFARKVLHETARWWTLGVNGTRPWNID